MRDVSQISPPIRILVISAIALMAAWMLFLRPKTEVVEPVVSTPAPNVATGQPAVSEPGKVGQAAKDAVAATNAKTEASESMTGTTGTAPAPATAVKPVAGSDKVRPGFEPRQDVDVAGLPKPVAKAVNQRKVLALLFWNPKSPDDRAVRRSMRAVDRWDGQVVLHTAPVNKVSRYAPITRGADVVQSPTVVVIDRNLKAETLVGFVDTATIDQAVVDAMRNSGGLFESRYLASVNQMCMSAGGQAFAVANPTQVGQVPGFVSGNKRAFSRLNTQFAALPAPARFRGFKRATVRDHRAMVAMMTEWGAFLGSKPSNARVVASLDKFGPREVAIAKRYRGRMSDQHLLACGQDVARP
jgi:hypothetical protein